MSFNSESTPNFSTFTGSSSLTSSGLGSSGLGSSGLTSSDLTSDAELVNKGQKTLKHNGSGLITSLRKRFAHTYLGRYSLKVKDLLEDIIIINKALIKE